MRTGTASARRSLRLGMSREQKTNTQRQAKMKSDTPRWMADLDLFFGPSGAAIGCFLKNRPRRSMMRLAAVLGFLLAFNASSAGADEKSDNPCFGGGNAECWARIHAKVE